MNPWHEYVIGVTEYEIRKNERAAKVLWRDGDIEWARERFKTVAKLKKKLYHLTGSPKPQCPSWPI